MSDLISRSELLKAFNNKNVQITFDLPVEEVLGEDVDLDDFAMLVQDAIQAYKKMVTDTIKNQPTAYSVDKVVEELKQKKEEVQRMRNTCVALSDLEVCDIENFTYERAIEIVKQGGVSDDVCEWHGEQSRLVTYTNFTTACGYNFDLQMNNELLKAFRYCPYCGKKIKVGGMNETK